MTDNKQNTRLNLLSELQSIKELLIECESELNSPFQNKTPTVSEHEPTEEEPMMSSKSPLPQAPGVLPGQQSLFELTNHCPNATEPELPPQSHRPDKQVTPQKSANPFRPDHLKSDKTTQLSATKRPAIEAPPTNQAEPNLSVTEDEIEQQIDQLVAKYLPQMETELRSHLRQLLDEKLQLSPLTDS